MRDVPRVESLSIPSDPARIREARHWVTGIAREQGLNDDDARAVALVVSEACSNIHRHAYGGSREGRIDLRLEVDRSSVRLSVRDYAPPFDPADWTPPDLSRPKEGGYGIYLMKSLMDHVEFVPSPAGTRLVLEKARRPDRADGDDGMSKRRKGLSISNDAETLSSALQDLCRDYEIGTELLELCQDPEALVERIALEYEAGPGGDIDAREMLSLVAHAVALHVRSETQRELDRLAEEIRAANRRADEAVSTAQRERERNEGQRQNVDEEVLRTVAVLAHKINNPLTALMGRTQLLRLTAKKSPEIDKGLAVIEQASRRISDLIRHLAMLAKEGKTDGLEEVLDLDGGPGAPKRS